MLTVLESVSLAGNRAKQNDDACGSHGPLAWVIDGATDLHDHPFSGSASDAAWLARELDTTLAACAAGSEPSFAGLRDLVREASEIAADLFVDLAAGRDVPPWAKPIASVLIIADSADGLVGLDLGDCALFTLDALGETQTLGGIPGAADNESRSAATFQADQPAADGKELYQTTAALEALRQHRAAYNLTGTAEVYGLDPTCADRARTWHVELRRPAHILLASDGFSALVDKYGLYQPQDLVRLAVDRGLVSLMQDLRAFEADDASTSSHPRFKRSDDATALLLRLD
jgi:hypothetical protein